MSRARVKIPAHLRALARRARAEGWTVTRTGSGHVRWSPPRGRPVITGSTPESYGHGPRNALKELAKAGLGARRG